MFASFATQTRSAAAPFSRPLRVPYDSQLTLCLERRLEMKRIVLELSEEAYESLKNIGDYYACEGMKGLLRGFIGDLTHTENTGGSDERLKANEWLDRRYCTNWYLENLGGKS